MSPFQKKLLANTNFVKTKLRVSAVHAKYGETHISGNNSVPNVFGVVKYHLKGRIVRCTFHALLYWKQGFPQVQFLLLFTFKS